MQLLSKRTALQQCSVKDLIAETDQNISEYGNDSANENILVAQVRDVFFTGCTILGRRRDIRGRVD